MKIIPGMKFYASIGDGDVLMQTVRQNGMIWYARRLDSPNVIIPYSASLTELMIKEYQEQQKNESDEERWWSSLKLGSFVHYYARSGFVRGEVVDGRYEKHPGKHNGRCMKAVALVGEFHETDLPRRNPDGTIYYGVYGDEVRRGYMYRAAWWNMYESPCFTAHRNPPDPRKLNPIDLSLPVMTGDEKEAARLWKRVKQVENLMNRRHQNETDPSVPKAILLKIKKLCATVE